MRKLSLIFAATLLCAQPPARLAIGYDSIQPALLKADLTFLSAEALEGRLSLARGSEVAIQWIASEFAKAGLKPASGDSFLQPVPLIEFTPDRQLTTFAVAREGQAVETFRAPDATSNFPNEVSLSGEVVFAGYGITAPELNYDDYAGIRARGKVVLIFNHEPQENDPASVFNGIGNTRYANNNYKLFNAQRHGAIAVLAMPDPNHQGPQRRVTAATARLSPQALADGGPVIPLFTVGGAYRIRSSPPRRSVHRKCRAALTPRRRPLPSTSPACGWICTPRPRRDAARRPTMSRDGSKAAIRRSTRKPSFSAGTSTTKAPVPPGYITAPTTTAPALSGWWRWRMRSRPTR